VGIALLVMLGVEWQLHAGLAPLEAQNAALNAAPAASPAEQSGFAEIGGRDPAAFFAWVRDHLQPPIIVFIGDSQGMVVKDGTGLPYPQLVARALARQPGGARVMSLHLGGANTFEQGILLLGMLRAGIVPRTVVWSHTVFSMRKNEIRSELVALYQSLPGEITGGPTVILIGGSRGSAGGPAPPGRRELQAAEQRLDAWLSASATMRFFRRPMADKAQILWACPVARLVPAAWRPRTAEQRDPPASILESSARFAGRVSGVLREHGVRVIDFLGPIDQAAHPQPFTARAEAVAYPALERAVRSQGGDFEPWFDALPAACFGKFADGSDDAFHIEEAGHEALAQRLLATLAR
jgi:hypothetical protein